MQINKNTACQFFKIKQPRWRDRTVLLAAHKIGTHNEIVFTDAPTYPGSYYVSGRDAHMSERTNNGKIDVYAVPLGILEPLERI